MSALIEYLSKQKSQASPLDYVSIVLSIPVRELQEECLLSDRIEYIPTREGGYAVLHPEHERKLTREDRKISKSKQP